MTKTFGLVAALLIAQASPSDLKRQLLALVQQLPETPPPAGTPTMVMAGENLQTALARGGTIELQSGATYTGQFTIIKSNTRINGHNAKLVGTTGPALYIPPDVDDTWVGDLTLTSAWSGGVVQCGDNGPTQTLLSQQPERTVFVNLTIPTHRGKRGFELNCSATVIDATVLDVYSSAGADSQALWVGNTCGPVMVLRGTFVAASENIMIGGDAMKLPCVPSGLVFEDLTLSKPDAWRTGGPAVKNLFEVKGARNVIVRNVKAIGSWKSGQDGWCVVITPRNGAYIQDVLLEGVTCERVGGGVQLLGVNDVTVTPEATSGIVIRNSKFSISKAENGGRGILALLVGGVLDVSWENVDATFDGAALVVADSTKPQGPFVMRNSRVGLGTYGIQAPGANYGNPTSGAYVGRELAVVLEGNTLTPGAGMSASGLKAVKSNFPKNTYTP